MLAWTPSRLPEGLAARARRTSGVRRVAMVRSGVAWLTRWSDAGGVDRRPPQGLAVPVEVAGVEPSGYQWFVPPAERPFIAGLARGGAVLGRTAAALREVGPGATLHVAGVTLRVNAILDDELVGAHEVVVSAATARGLGITRPRYLLVDPVGKASRDHIERSLRGALPSGTRLRIRGPGETPVFRHGDAVLPPVRLKELFGEFAARPGPGGVVEPDPTWVAENIRSARLPILGRLVCHRRVLPQIRGALRELVAMGLTRHLDPGDFGGCYSPRFANRNPSAGLSHHAWGVAFDVNVSENPLGGEPRLDRRVVEVFERWGLTWGGRWLVPDGMHFEFLTFPGT
jgi:hypothetical protein